MSLLFKVASFGAVEVTQQVHACQGGVPEFHSQNPGQNKQTNKKPGCGGISM